jgi:hypothetical protein
MLVHILAQASSDPRFDGNTVNTVIIALMIGAVAMVFWASRPSVIARHRPPAQNDAPGAAPPTEKEPRA